mgnify:CR=1 FL=1
MCVDSLLCIPVNAAAHIIVTLNIEESSNTNLAVAWYAVFYYHLRKLKEECCIEHFTIVTNATADVVFLGSSVMLDLLSSIPNLLTMHWFMCTQHVLYPQQFNWNPTSNRVLYFPGKLDKIHRVGPLYSILTNNRYKTNCVYAYTANQSVWNGGNRNLAVLYEQYYTTVSDLLGMYNTSISDYDNTVKLLEENEKDIDGMQAECRSHQRCSVAPISSEVYSSISVELISETWFPSLTEHLTEKTFRAMLAGQPFIHVSSMVTCYLNALGFKTFRNLTGDRWDSHGYTNIAMITYSNDIEMQIQDLHSNVAAAFELADKCKNEVRTQQQVRDIIQFNRQKCEQIIAKTKNDLNRRHNGVFGNNDTLFDRFFSIHGLY